MAYLQFNVRDEKMIRAFRGGIAFGSGVPVELWKIEWELGDYGESLVWRLRGRTRIEDKWVILAKGMLPLDPENLQWIKEAKLDLLTELVTCVLKASFHKSVKEIVTWSIEI